MKFRKKPVEIEAWQWGGKSPVYERPEWLRDANVLADLSKGILLIDTLEGTMTAQPGDWIIKGVKNEIYPCKPDIFEQTYEPVADPNIIHPNSPDASGPFPEEDT